MLRLIRDVAVRGVLSRGSFKRHFASRIPWDEGELSARFRKQGLRETDLKRLIAFRNEAGTLLSRLEVNQKVALEEVAQVLGGTINPYRPLYHRQIPEENEGFRGHTPSKVAYQIRSLFDSNGGPFSKPEETEAAGSSEEGPKWVTALQQNVSAFRQEFTEFKHGLGEALAMLSKQHDATNHMVGKAATLLGYVVQDSLSAGIARSETFGVEGAQPLTIASAQELATFVDRETTKAPTRAQELTEALLSDVSVSA
jgi:hypothetical protein